MPKWFNPKLTLFHRCDDGSVGAPPRIGVAPAPHNIDLRLCRPRTDFGQGFYTTTSDHQAKQWANLRCRRILSRVRGAPRAVLLRFEVDRDAIAQLETLVFVRDTRDFYNLVDDCRLGFAPHNRAAPAAPSYDLVCGPVSLWQQELVIQNCDQMSFHTPAALRALPSPTIVARGRPLF